MTYAFVPRNFLRGLFALLDTDLPERFTEPDFKGLSPDDTIPSNIDPSTISVICAFLLTPFAFFAPNPTHYSWRAGRRQGH